MSDHTRYTPKPVKADLDVHTTDLGTVTLHLRGRIGIDTVSVSIDGEPIVEVPGTVKNTAYSLREAALKWIEQQDAAERARYGVAHREWLADIVYERGLVAA